MPGKKTVTIKKGLTDDNQPIFEGQIVTKGSIPFTERVKDKYDDTCETCGKENCFTGVYRVSINDYLLYRRIHDVEFECLKCLHANDPETYPHGSRSDKSRRQ